MLQTSCGARLRPLSFRALIEITPWLGVPLPPLPCSHPPWSSICTHVLFPPPTIYSHPSPRTAVVSVPWPVTPRQGVVPSMWMNSETDEAKTAGTQPWGVPPTPAPAMHAGCSSQAASCNCNTQRTLGVLSHINKAVKFKDKPGKDSQE